MPGAGKGVAIRGEAVPRSSRKACFSAGSTGYVGFRFLQDQAVAGDGVVARFSHLRRTGRLAPERPPRADRNGACSAPMKMFRFVQRLAARLAGSAAACLFFRWINGLRWIAAFSKIVRAVAAVSVPSQHASRSRRELTERRLLPAGEGVAIREGAPPHALSVSPALKPARLALVDLILAAPSPLGARRPRGRLRVARLVIGSALLGEARNCAGWAGRQRRERPGYRPRCRGRPAVRPG